MIKGLAITPPVVGRISIGHVVEKNGQRLPEKDDQFTVTTQIQTQEGWIRHPLDEQLRNETDNGKLRTIPVRMLFNDPELNFRAEYSLFDWRTGRPQCVGDGETCRRFTAEGVQTLPCPGPDACELAQGGACKPYGRLHVRIGDDDELGTFIFRTTGYNSIRTLAARLRYYQAVSGDLLACMPLELRLRGKSTTQSYRSAIYYVDLTVREGLTLEEAIARSRETHQRREAQGYDQAALDAVARQAIANAAFETDREEGGEIMEEFFPEAPHLESGAAAAKSQAGSPEPARRTLGEKLDRKAAPSPAN